jgi:hypothetical protein
MKKLWELLPVYLGKNYQQTGGTNPGTHDIYHYDHICTTRYFMGMLMTVKSTKEEKHWRNLWTGIWFCWERESSKDHLSVIMSKTAPNVETEPPGKKNVNQILHLIHLFLLFISYKKLQISLHYYTLTSSLT